MQTKLVIAELSVKIVMLFPGALFTELRKSWQLKILVLLLLNNLVN